MDMALDFSLPEKYGLRVFENRLQRRMFGS
jgi:hypothetical protein